MSPSFDCGSRHRRRALARSSRTVRPACRRCRSGVDDSTCGRLRSSPSSRRRRWPVRTRARSTRAPRSSSMRSASCSFDISSEKTATPVPAWSAALAAMFRQKAVLPMLGPPGDDDEVGGLEPRRQPVEVGEARRDAGDRLLLLVQLLDDLEGRVIRLSMRTNAGFTSRSEMSKMRLLGAVEQLLDVAATPRSRAWRCPSPWRSGSAGSPSRARCARSA